MVSFWMFIVCLIAAVVVFILARAMTRPSERRGVRIGAGALAGLALLFLIISICAPVGTKNVAILTTFGKPGPALGNGFHLKAPWQVKHELSDAIQTDTYASDKGEGTQEQADGSCINVRIARQATACVNISVRWQIRQEGVGYLFRNHRDNASITRDLLLRDIQTAVNENFGGYDPLGLDEFSNSTQPSASVLAQRVQTTMRKDIGEWIEVDSVLIPIFNFDKGTQDKLNALQQQYAATRVAKQQEQTNIAQAAANRALAASVSNNPGVLQSKCLDIVKESVETNKPLPAGFTCFGGSSQLALSTGK